MPTSVPRGAPFLLLPPLLMLSAVLAVPLDRAAPHPEENQATESPVSSPALYSGVFVWCGACHPQGPSENSRDPVEDARLVVYLPSFAVVCW